MVADDQDKKAVVHLLRLSAVSDRSSPGLSIQGFEIMCGRITGMNQKTTHTTCCRAARNLDFVCVFVKH